MLTYQRSKICSPQSCSQSVDGDEGAFEALHFAAYEQLWLTYNAMEPTANRPYAQISLFMNATRSSRGGSSYSR
jgi:hypothetical protein